MAITTPVYATREMVKRSLDIMETARANAQIDRLLQSCSRTIDGDLHRTFYPRLDTLEWDWLNSSSPTPWRLWLDDKEIIELLTFTSGGISIPTADLIMYPSEGPPYNRIEIDLSTTSSFTLGNTHQNALSVHALFGYSLELESLGGLVAAINSSVGALTVPNGSLVGVGDLLKVESEYVLVTGRTWVDSTQNLQTDMAATANAVTVAVTDGTAFFVDETVLLDAEKMLIVDIAGNNLFVKRAWDGSTLATHASSDVYVPRSLTVSRGAVGSTAVSHLISTTVSRWVPPSLVGQLCIGEVLTAIEQEQSSYARVVGSGETAFEARGVGLEDLRTRACGAHGRKVRHRAI